MARLQQLQVARTVRPLCPQSRTIAPTKLLQQKTLMGLSHRSSKQLLL